MLEAPLKFERDGKTYRFSGPVATGKLIAGTVLPTKVASPTGSLDMYCEVPLVGNVQLAA